MIARSSWWATTVAVLMDLLTLVVRGVGLALLGVGLWISIEVVMEAWALYRDPTRITAFAAAIEQHTGIDALLASATASADGGHKGLRVSYLVGWFLAPALLFTAGYLAMTAARIGGQLALGGERNSKL